MQDDQLRKRVQNLIEIAILKVMLEDKPKNDLEMIEATKSSAKDATDAILYFIN